MDSASLVAELCADKDWHMKELAVYKSIPHRYSLQTFKLIESSYWKMCVPMIYAHWEGFCVSCLLKICDYLNSQSLTFNIVIDEIAVLSMDRLLKKLSGQSINKDKEIEFYNSFLSQYGNAITIEPNTAITANSNLNYKQLSYMLGQLGIDIDSITDLSTRKPIIEKLVTFRNKIAHGENSLVVSESDVVTFILEVNCLFDSLVFCYI